MMNRVKKTKPKHKATVFPYVLYLELQMNSHDRGKESFAPVH